MLVVSTMKWVKEHHPSSPILPRRVQPQLWCGGDEHDSPPVLGGDCHVIAMNYDMNVLASPHYTPYADTKKKYYLHHRGGKITVVVGQLPWEKHSKITEVLNHRGNNYRGGQLPGKINANYRGH